MRGEKWVTVPKEVVLNYVAERSRQAQFIERAVLFGSRARSDERPTSDYDVAFTLKPGTSKGDWLAFQYHLDEDAPTLCRITMIEYRDSLRPELLENIKKEGQLIYER